MTLSGDPASSARTFRPSARATNWLLVLGFSSIGYALYLRYLVIEQSTVGLACEAGLATWLCATRRVVIALFSHSVFSGLALLAAAVHFLRPSIVPLAIGIVAAGFGVVLYNVAASALAIAILTLSFARPSAGTA